MLVLEVESYGVSQIIIMDDKAVLDKASMINVDSRTRRVHVTLPESFFTAVLAPGRINLKGFTTVRTTSPDIYASPLTAEFTLDLEFVNDVSMVYSFCSLAAH